jgi:polyphosphate kinase
LSDVVDPTNFLNREMSWLEFNQRVLEQAADSSNRLLERCKFLAITYSNLDEFFMVRVGGLRLQQSAGARSSDPSGMSVEGQLAAIRTRTQELVAQQYQLLREQLEPKLKQHGIKRINMSECSLKHSEVLQRTFESEILPVLSPLGIEPDSEFPLLTNRLLHIAVQIENTAEDETSSESNLPYRFAIIPLSDVLPRVLALPAESGFSFILLEEIVQGMVQELFPQETIVSTTVFRATRNADISLQEDSAADLLHGMKELLLQRTTSECVRLEVLSDVTEEVLSFLTSSLKVEQNQIYRCPGPLDLGFLMQLSGTKGFDHLRNPAWPAQRSPQVDPSVPMFETIAEQDILLNHPYEGYAPVVRFVNEAADDPDVLAIKQTLYRTSRDSAIVGALKRAAKKGKYVTAIVELKARFDEARNIEWAEELQRAGVEIVYGVKRLKTHAKICIIVRREPRGIVRYVHFGTGNYNEATARLYSDISYFTCNEQLGRDASAFFNAITGFSQPQQYQLIEAAPIGLRKRLLSLIDAEIERRKQGQRAAITAKLNALVDAELITALYRASQAGVTIHLNIRGICCLRPGVPGLSENITVVSIVDRLLEHARVVTFYHGGDNLTFISSADWMPRNLDKRIELLAPIIDKSCRQYLLKILKTYSKDNTNAWQLSSDGTYTRRSGGEKIRAQELLYNQAVEAVKMEEQKRKTIFEPHHPSEDN